MSKPFDARHRWGPAVRNGVLITRTCGVCGRSESHETLVPDEVFDLVLAQLRAPNPFRKLVRTQ